MTERQLASLLYRDHLSMKHANKDRFKEELYQAKALEDELAPRMEQRNTLEDASPLLRAMVAHLKEAA